MSKKMSPIAQALDRTISHLERDVAKFDKLGTKAGMAGVIARSTRDKIKATLADINRSRTNVDRWSF